MKIIEGENDFVPPHNAVVTIGTFDGMHLGHQKILRRISKLAKTIHGDSVVVTFWPHPRFVLNPHDQSLKLLSTFDEKATLLEKVGIDYLVKIPFTKDFSEMGSEEFIRKILIGKINTQVLVIGHDHRFGHNREGGFDYLQENKELFGFKVEEISRQDIDDVGISSTKIRKALTAREVRVANAYLGRPYSLKGKVVEGNKLGRTIGFPTANLEIDQPYKLVPADGTYAIVAIVHEQRYGGMLNIGMRPTVDGATRTIEANLFGFDEQIYNESVEVHFIDQIREEVKFGDVAALKAQLEKDRLVAMQLLAESMWEV